jgi:hypothetical protein
MTTRTPIAGPDSFSGILSSTIRSSEIPPQEDLYGWLVGSWELEVVSFDDQGVRRRSLGEAHVSRVLEGRAVQDVFINPRRPDRDPSMAKFANWFGTTLRLYDPNARVWRIWWFNPVDGLRAELTGRLEGRDIVQEGTFPDGTPIRWTFSEISPNSFLWRGERLNPDDKSWGLQVEFRGRRRRPSSPAVAPRAKARRPAARGRLPTHEPGRRR